MTLKNKKQTSKNKGVMGSLDFKIHPRWTVDGQGHQKVELDPAEYKRLLRSSSEEITEDISEEILDLDELMQTAKETKFQERESIKAVLERWSGLALKAPPNPHPRFQTEDDLWKDDV